MRKSLWHSAIFAGAGFALTGCFDAQVTQPSSPAENVAAPAARTAGMDWVQVYEYVNQGFYVPCRANDISVGQDGAVYRVSTSDIGDGNYPVEKWKTGANGFEAGSMSAVQIAVSHEGRFMALRADGYLWDVVGNDWTPLGQSREVSAYGTTYGYRVNQSTAPTGGYTISRRWGNTWQMISGSGHRAVVAPNGDLWVLNYDADWTVWKRPSGSSSWTQVTGKRALEIAASHDGTIYILSQEDFLQGGHQIFKYDPGIPGNWQPIFGAGIKIAGGPDKTLWVVSSDKSIWYSSDPPNG